MAINYDININAKDNASRVIGRVERELNKVSATAGGRSGFPAVAAGITGVAAAATVAVTAVTALSRSMLNASASLQQMQNRLGLTVNSTAELSIQMERLRNLAVQNRTSFSDTVGLYTNLKLATEDLGYSTETVEKLTTKLSQALAVAGADAATTSSVIRQFGQAMASGTVRGDEFNSLVEGLGPALSIMARESGISVGKLREMSQAGELTADTMASLLLNSNSLTESFNNMTPSLGSLETQLGDTWTKFLADISNASGLTDGYKNLVQDLTSDINSLNTILTGSDLSASGITQRLAEIEAQSAALQEIVDNTSTFDQITSGFTGGLLGKLLGTDSSKYLDAIASLATLNAEANTLREELDQLNASGRGVDFEQLIQDVSALTSEFEASNAAAEKFANDLTAAFSASGGSSAITSIEAYVNAIKMADEAIKTQAAGTTEYSKAIISAENAVNSTAQAIMLLNEGFNRARMMDQSGLELIQMRNAYYERMNALMVMQAQNIDALTAARTAEAQAIINGNNSLHTQAYLEQQAFTQKVDLLSQVNQQLTQNTALTNTQRAALEDMRVALENQILGIDTTVQSLQTFNQYYRELLTTTAEAINSQSNMSQAVTQLDADLASGVITMSQYTAALQNLSNAGATLTLPQNVTVMQDRLAAMREEAALNPQIAAQLKELNNATNEELVALGLIAPARRASTRSKREDLTVTEQLIETLKKQQTELEQTKQALADVSAISRATGVSEDFLTTKLEEQIKSLEDNLGILKDRSNTISGIMKTTWDDMSKTMASSITRGLMEGRGAFNSFADFLKDFSNRVVSQIIEKMLIQPMIDQLSNWGSQVIGGFSGMGGGTSGAGGGLGGLLGSLFGGGGGLGNFFSGLWGGVSSFFGNIFGGFFADGGYLPAGKVGIVGEAGPEMITGPANITPMSGGGEGLTVNFNISAIDTQSGTQFILDHKQEIEGVIQNAYNRRGKEGIY